MSMTYCYTGHEPDTTGKDTASIFSVMRYKLLLYPNPTNGGALHFLSDSERYDGADYEIIGMDGRLLLRGKYVPENGIDVNGLSKGVYVLRMGTYYGKFVKQ